MENETVLVTGGAGYIGSHVCKALSKKGYLPVCYDNLISGNKEAVKWGPFEEGDVRDEARVVQVIKNYNPSAIMHFAALIQVAESVSNPDLYYDCNVAGSYTLLKCAKNNDLAKLVFSSTAAVYGIPEHPLIKEDHPLRPINPYGNTKLAMENMIRDFSASYGMNYAILRYFNAAGADSDIETGTAYPKDTHILPILMNVAIEQSDSFNVFGNDYQTPDGTAIRDYVHVSDLAEAHILALESISQTKQNMTLNFGTSHGISVHELLETARKVTGQPIPAILSDRRPGDPDILVADSSQAKKLLNWSPLQSSAENIIRTAWNWRKKQAKYGRIGAYQ